MAKHISPDEQRLLVKVSKLYYEENLNQDKIVERLHLSRPKVSRLLQRARNVGIVQINVVTPDGIMSALESRLEACFNLQEAIVVEARPSDPQSVVSRQLGITAASFLGRSLGDNDLIGISWGTTLHHMVTALQPIETKNVHVVQIIGGLGQPEAEVHATDLCRRLSHTLGARLTLLPVPGIVNNLRTKEAFLSDSYVQRAVELFPKLDVAFVGIGSPTPDSVVMKDGSIIDNHELEELLSHGAVGDIALRYFDCYGRPIRSDVDSRVIGIDLEQLTSVKRVVGVAGGHDKTTAILGALRGKLVDVLITDSITGQKILDMADLN
jgi:DNA-binding transcriptional regulator LsrR (DeoR family)